MAQNRYGKGPRTIFRVTSRAEPQSFGSRIDTVCVPEKTGTNEPCHEVRYEDGCGTFPRTRFIAGSASLAATGPSTAMSST